MVSNFSYQKEICFWFPPPTPPLSFVPLSNWKSKDWKESMERQAFSQGRKSAFIELQEACLSHLYPFQEAFTGPNSEI